VPGDRLLGSYVIRVSAIDGARSIALHSILTGESRRFDDFASLAAFLERATTMPGRDAGDEGPLGGIGGLRTS
jgi:hypothetical protein